MTQKYDVIVIGGGPGGYTSAIAAAKRGKKTAIFEKADLGGTCLNVGCIPTKFLLDKAAAIEKIRDLTDKGIFREAGLFSFKKIQAEKSKVVKRLTGGVGALLKKNGVYHFSDEAVLHPNRVVVSDGKEFTADNVIIATGSEPVRIPIPGAELAIDSSGALNLEKVPGRLTVVGGGVIGLEMASAFASFGSEVTVVEVLEELSPGEERAAVNQMKRALEKRGIKLLLGGRIEEIKKADYGLTAVCRYQGEPMRVAADQVLMAVGRKPRLDGINAELLGIKLTDKGFIAVDTHMRTNLPNVYAVGDVAGGYQLAHAAFAEAEVAVSNICGKVTENNADYMPRCIYTSPAFAAVGTTSEKAKHQGIECITGSFPYEGNGMALAEGASGTIYVLMDTATKKTLGVQIVGEGAPELISFATAAVVNGTTLEEWEKLVVAHPSLSEMIKEAALDCFGKAIHK